MHNARSRKVHHVSSHKLVYRWNGGWKLRNVIVSYAMHGTRFHLDHMRVARHIRQDSKKIALLKLQCSVRKLSTTRSIRQRSRRSINFKKRLEKQCFWAMNKVHGQVENGLANTLWSTTKISLMQLHTKVFDCVILVRTNLPYHSMFSQMLQLSFH